MTNQVLILSMQHVPLIKSLLPLDLVAIAIGGNSLRSMNFLKGNGYCCMTKSTATKVLIYS